jgi:hypothetical protein
VLGKLFCRWKCPLGAVMETLLGAIEKAFHDRRPAVLPLHRLGPVLHGAHEATWPADPT